MTVLEAYEGKRGATKTVMVEIAVDRRNVVGKQVQELTLVFQEGMKKVETFEKYPDDLGNGDGRIDRGSRIGVELAREGRSVQESDECLFVQQLRFQLIGGWREAESQTLALL